MIGTPGSQSTDTNHRRFPEGEADRLRSVPTSADNTGCGYATAQALAVLARRWAISFPNLRCAVI